MASQQIPLPRSASLAVALGAGVLATLTALAVAAPEARAHDEGGSRRATHRVGLLVAASRAKETAAHVCEDIDDPPPCYVTGLESCSRLTPRKVECGVAVHFSEQSADCVWTIYVFWKHGEITESEGRSEC